MGLTVAARRHGVDWPGGLEHLQYSKPFNAALARIVELEDNQRDR